MHFEHNQWKNLSRKLIYSPYSEAVTESHIENMLFLNDGNDIPQIGLAAFRIDSNEETKDIIRKSLASGVRHFEITELFGNGHTIVEGLFDSGLVQRKDVCISLKIWPKSRNSRDLIFACRSTLEFVGLDYVDIVMVHAPIEVNSRHDQWKAMEALVEEGLAKSLGISNITALQLAELLKSCNIPPAIFQVCLSFTERLSLSPVVLQCNVINLPG